MNNGHFKLFRMTSYSIIILMSQLSTSSTQMSTRFTTTTTTISDLCSAKEAFWKIASKSLVFGEDVELICKTTAGKDLCTSCTMMWTGGPELSLLSLNGYPTTNSKYSPSKGKDYFSITIRNFSRQDLNQDYICSIDFNSCKRNLTIDMFDDDMFDENISKVVLLSETYSTILTAVLGAILICCLVIGLFIWKWRPNREDESFKKQITADNSNAPNVTDSLLEGNSSERYSDGHLVLWIEMLNSRSL